MRTKLLVTAALAAALAMPAMADKGGDGPEKLIELVDPKKPEITPPVVKTEDDLDSVRDLFSIDEGELGRDFEPTEFYQQQRVLQDGEYNYVAIDQTASGQGLASVAQKGDNNIAYTTQTDTDAPPGSAIPFSKPANISVTTQTGDGNYAVVDQYGDAHEKPYANRADIHQYAPEGYAVSNDAYVLQQGNDNTLTTITQGSPDAIGGLNNSAYVIQTGNDGSFIGIAQANDGNEAIVHQTNTGFEPDFLKSSVSLQQVSEPDFAGIGENNFAEIYQFDGYALTIEAYQENTGGAANGMSISQTGWANGIWVDQIGAGNDMWIGQSGEFNRIESSQDGYDQSLELTQSGTYNTFYSHQGDEHGQGNSIIAEQSGNYNLASVSQKGDYNEVDLSQEGYLNTMLLEQHGDGNYINASQAAGTSFDVISVSQSGAYNAAHVSQ